jgi:hypothetical protein
MNGCVIHNLVEAFRDGESIHHISNNPYNAQSVVPIIVPVVPSHAIFPIFLMCLSLFSLYDLDGLRISDEVVVFGPESRHLPGFVC